MHGHFGLRVFFATPVAVGAHLSMAYSPCNLLNGIVVVLAMCVTCVGSNSNSSSRSNSNAGATTREKEPEKGQTKKREPKSFHCTQGTVLWMWVMNQSMT